MASGPRRAARSTIGDPDPAEVAGRRHGPRVVAVLDGVRRVGDPRSWSLWTNTAPVLTLVLTVDLLAVVLATLAVVGDPVRSADLVTFALLTAGALIHHEVSRHVERLREISADGRAYIDLKSMWTFAGLLLLPLSLALALVVITFGYWWLRVSRRPVLHRWIFSGAAVVLASLAAHEVLALTSTTTTHHPADGPWGLLAIAGAALLRWTVNVVLVATVLTLSAPGSRWSLRLGSATDNLLMLGALALGIILAQLAHSSPWLIPVLLLPLLTMHRGFLVHQLALAAHTDPKTGLVTAKHWQANAVRDVARARRRGLSLGVLMVDLDDFKTVNDTWGHLAGDEVLRVVAEALRAEVRTEDAVGRFGGEEFVVLLDDLRRCPLATGHLDELDLVGQPAVSCGCTSDPMAVAAATAERLRRRVHEVAVTVPTADGDHVVDGLSISVGVAIFPDTARSLDDLVLAADTALYEAKRAGRDRVRCAPGG